MDNAQVGTSGGWMVHTAMAALSCFTIDELCPNTNHELRICAVYSTGIGPPSRPHYFTTLLNPKGPPRPSVVKCGMLQGSLIMTWEVKEPKARRQPTHRRVFVGGAYNSLSTANTQLSRTETSCNEDGCQH